MAKEHSKTKEHSDKKSKKHREKSTTADAPSSPAPVTPAVDIPSTTESNGVKKSKDKKDKKDKKSRKSLDAAVAAESDDLTGPLMAGLDAELAKSAADAGTLAKAETNDATSMDEAAAQAIIASGISPLATPLAQGKVLRKVLKGVAQAAQHKVIKRGVKEVVKVLRKSVHEGPPATKFIVVLAADVFPIDVTSHLPIMCENRKVPYIFVHTRESLGSAGGTKRPTAVILIPLNRGKKASTEAGHGDEEWAAIFQDLAKTIIKASKEA